MTTVTGSVQDLGMDPIDGTLYARPVRFRTDGQVIFAPERKPYKIEAGQVSADLAPGPAVLELQVGSHARGTFEVVIPDQDSILLADLLDSVFPWEPAQISLFVAEREAAQQAAADAETAAGTATTAAQQTGQDRSHVDQVRTELDEAFDESTAGNVLPPRLTETALNNTYGTKAEVNNILSSMFEGGPLKRGEVTFDPYYKPTIDGTLVLILKEPPTQFFTDFTEYPIGEQPRDWTMRRNAGTWTVEADGESSGGVALYLSEESLPNRALSWGRVGLVEDAEIVFRWRSHSADTTFRPVVRGIGSSSGYVGGTQNGTRQSIQILDSPLRSVVEFMETGGAGWHLSRMRVSGTELFSKSWTDGEPEPDEWILHGSNSEVSGEGWVGIRYASPFNDGTIDWVGVGINGDPAPTGPVV